MHIGSFQTRRVIEIVYRYIFLSADVAGFRLSTLSSSYGNVAFTFPALLATNDIPRHTAHGAEPIKSSRQLAHLRNALRSVTSTSRVPLFRYTADDAIRSTFLGRTKIQLVCTSATFHLCVSDRIGSQIFWAFSTGQYFFCDPQYDLRFVLNTKFTLTRRHYQSTTPANHFYLPHNISSSNKMSFPRNRALVFVALAVSMVGLACAQATKFHTCNIRHIVVVPIPVRPTPGFIPHFGVRCINSVTVGTDTVTDFVHPMQPEIFQMLVASNEKKRKRNLIIQYFTDGSTTAGMCGPTFCRKLRSVIML